MLKILFSTVLLGGLGLVIATTSPDLGAAPGVPTHHAHSHSVVISR